MLITRSQKEGRRGEPLTRSSRPPRVADRSKGRGGRSLTVQRMRQPRSGDKRVVGAGVKCAKNGERV